MALRRPQTRGARGSSCVVKEQPAFYNILALPSSLESGALSRYSTLGFAEVRWQLSQCLRISEGAEPRTNLGAVRRGLDLRLLHAALKGDCHAFGLQSAHQYVLEYTSFGSSETHTEL